MNLLYLECSMGAAGDMLMGALFELLTPKEQENFLHQMNHLGFHDVTLSVSRREKCGIFGTHMNVLIHGKEEDEYMHTHSHEDDTHSHPHSHPHGDDIHSHPHSHSHEVLAHDHMHNTESHHHSHHHSSYQDMLHLITHLPLSDTVKSHAQAVYQLIGNAEAKAHESALEHIHFHEVGTLDALMDVVGCCLLIELLHPDQILASPVHVGSGTIRCAHGVLPVPAPATAEILTGVPIYGGQIQGELCTPTGAALLRHFASDFLAMPPMTVSKTGYGMGTRDFPQANCLRAFWGSSGTSSSDDVILSLSCNLDDMTGEALGFAAEELMRHGALDVYVVPILMKKGRPGHLLTCLCTPEQEIPMSKLIFCHTTTRGIRIQKINRRKLSASYQQQESPYGPVTIKQNDGYDVCRRKPEYEDMAKIAREQDISFLQVSQEISSSL
ncbi:MAG: nickel pincer cofactor biosynthesis protein LarC [Lachnospiraceae bacterium]|nr:nickel pincer cofactor biosynthesis protein LarC [Lachnospiraceae bacterium]